MVVAGHHVVLANSDIMKNATNAMTGTKIAIPALIRLAPAKDATKAMILSTENAKNSSLTVERVSMITRVLATIAEKSVPNALTLPVYAHHVNLTTN